MRALRVSAAVIGFSLRALGKLISIILWCIKTGIECAVGAAFIYAGRWVYLNGYHTAGWIIAALGAVPIAKAFAEITTFIPPMLLRRGFQPGGATAFATVRQLRRSKVVK